MHEKVAECKNINRKFQKMTIGKYLRIESTQKMAQKRKVEKYLEIIKGMDEDDRPFGCEKSIRFMHQGNLSSFYICYRIKI